MWTTERRATPCDSVTPVLGELHISGLGVIEDALIEPSAGLTAVTGETGAGKTMIVTALGLISGGRADAGRVRSGHARAVVEARFVPQRPGLGCDGARRNTGADGARRDYLAAAAEAVGGDVDEDGSLLAVRSVSADGRSRAHVGGRSAPVAALAELAEPLVAVHGQSEAIILLRPASQRAVLDRFADVDDELTAYRALRADWLAVRAEISDRSGRAREIAQREAVLRLGLDEIDRSAPRPGEDRDIAAEVRRLDDADALRTAAGGAVAALTGAIEELGAEALRDEPCAAGLVQQAVRQLEHSGDPALLLRLDDLRGVLAVLDDVGADLTQYVADLDADPARLAILLERQAVLRGLVRRYGEDVDAVLEWAAAARTELAGSDTSDAAITALRARAAELGSRLAQLAARLSADRSAAAEKLGAAATAELGQLAMSTASLRIAVTQRPAIDGADDALTINGRAVAAGPDGVDHVEILLTAHRGAPELPVARGASGGELSRIMLALEVVLAGADPVATLVFDEVDAGVGGRAATEIGRKLASLSRDHQVIVVTHLAQVAAFADRHYVVDAAADGSVGVSSVRGVDADDRAAELARMLSGTDGDVARAHAADLLAAARRSTHAAAASRATRARKRAGETGTV